MKKIALTIIAALSCILSANAQTVTKNYTVKNFTGITASHMFTIEVTKGNKYSMSIEAPENLFDEIRIRQHDKELDLSLKNDLPKKLRDVKESIYVKITMPNLDEVELSGAAKLIGIGVFTSTSGEFKAEVCGASRIKDLCIEATKVEIELSGASRADIFVDAREVDGEVCGASKLVLTGNAPKINIEASGASAINAKNINCKYMDLEADGASKAIVNVTETLKVDLSGAAKCEYIGPEDINLRVDNISGASTLKRVK